MLANYIVILASAAPADSSASDFPWAAVIIAGFIGLLVATLFRLYRSRREMERGMQLESEGRAEEAAEIFMRAARRDRRDAISRFHLGLCCELMGDAEGAKEAYESVADDPRCDFAARTRLAEIEKGRLLDKEKLVALDHFERGVGLLAKGDVDAAQDAFNEGAALHPRYRPVEYYLGVCAEMKSRPREAQGHYTLLLEEERETTLVQHRILAAQASRLWQPSDAKVAIRLRKAWNYLEIDDAGRAIDELEQIVREYPDEYTAHFGLALCHIHTGTPEAAREHYAKVPPEDIRHADAAARLKELDDIIRQGESGSQTS